MSMWQWQEIQEVLWPIAPSSASDRACLLLFAVEEKKMHSEENMLFSRRHGYRPEEREIVVRHDAPEELRGALLQIAREVGVSPKPLREVVCRVFRRLPDPNNWSEYPNIWEEVQSLILSCDWFRIYDVAEALYCYLKRDLYSSQADDFEDLLNEYFREAGIGWKMEDGVIVVRGSEIFEATVQGVTNVLNNRGRATASNEIHEAIRDISRRPEPDISGSIQHAMAALECVARDICGDAKLTLGDLLRRYPDRLSIPKPLDEAVSKAWGYASEMARHIREGRDPKWEDAEQPNVNKLYHGILCEAWSLADVLSGHPSIPLNELQSLRKQNLALKDQSLSDACFIYPEVSANVQGFVRSRVSGPGMYLLSDTGAATVDQSTFIFVRTPDNRDHLAYLHGSVLPCGSSHIELQAAKISGRINPEVLEMWRERKERGSVEQELTRAKNMLAEPLLRGTTATLACTKRKLYVPDQIREMRVIFGGGGHCEHPYKTSVIRPFSGQLFAPAIRPRVVGLPVPGDLELNGNQSRWMRRLAVAYGLSFERSDLAGFTYPRDVEPPEPDQVWSRRRDLPDFVGKDRC